MQIQFRLRCLYRSPYTYTFRKYPDFPFRHLFLPLLRRFHFLIPIRIFVSGSVFFNVFQKEYCSGAFHSIERISQLHLEDCVGSSGDFGSDLRCPFILLVTLKYKCLRLPPVILFYFMFDCLHVQCSRCSRVRPTNQSQSALHNCSFNLSALDQCFQLVDTMAISRLSTGKLMPTTMDGH